MRFIRILLIVLAVLASTPPVTPQARTASDFDLERVQKQLDNASDAIARIAAHLNLGDIRGNRSEFAESRRQYGTALEIAEQTARDARRRANLSLYARATAYAGLAEAKLGRTAAAIGALEEAVRYLADSAAVWNLYSSAMLISGQGDRAVALARSAVAVASGESERAEQLLSLNVYRYTLASALIGRAEGGDVRESRDLLETIGESLQSSLFSRVREQIARNESFEILSTTSDDSATFLSLWNRTHLRLGALYEDAGELDRARKEYQRVLDLRTDDPHGLAAMARLSRSLEEKERYFAASFEANPFSLRLVTEYEQFLAGHQPPSESPGSTIGATMRNAILHEKNGRYAAAAEAYAELTRQFPDNQTVIYLQIRNAIKGGRLDEAEALLKQETLPAGWKAEIEAALSARRTSRTRAERILRSEVVTEPRSLEGDELRAIIALLKDPTMTPEERAALDRLRFRSEVHFDAVVARTDGTTTFTSGSAGSVPFLFASPVSFRGAFDSSADLELEYRIVGLSEIHGRDALLLEPIRLSSLRVSS